MKVPKIKKSYCRTCKKHTEHKVAQAKTTGKRGSLKRGSINRAKKRGLGRGFGNLGNYGSKGALTSWKRYGAKTSKKIALKLTCAVCNKSQLLTLRRAKKVEIQ
jgi:large subunit ribosomal protein L44e